MAQEAVVAGALELELELEPDDELDSLEEVPLDSEDLPESPEPFELELDVELEPEPEPERLSVR